MNLSEICIREANKGRIVMGRIRLACMPWMIGLAALVVGSPCNAGEPSEPVEVSSRAMEIHRRSYVWDGHNDLPWAVREKTGRGFEEIDISKTQPDLHTDIHRLRAGNVGAQFWSVYVPADTIAQWNAFQTTMEQIDLVHQMIAKYPDTFELALNATDVKRIQAKGKIASLIGMEGGHSIEDSLSKLRQLHQRGARYMTLTHSDTLQWADAATDTARSGGLSPFGEEVVREMNRLGMLVDLSHVSPETMEDALRISQAPVIFSHSSARAIADHPRNVPDAILKQLPANGGVVLINFFSGFVVPESARIMSQMFEVRRNLKEQFGKDEEGFTKAYRKWQAEHPYPQGEVAIVMDHIDHVVRTAGIDHVGLGSDFDGISRAPRGLEDVSCYPVLTELMLRRGYDEAAIHKVLSGNLMRVMERSDEVANNLSK
jgi:membrane dipeptidase